jgi:FkbM family methyltransferase
MNRLLATTIQRLIQPRETSNRIQYLLQKIRRRSFRIFYASQNGYFSQAGQDQFLNEVVFKGKRGGIFVEIGAADGIAFSNTYFFERELSWSGICVEPRPEAFTRLTATRKCRCVQTCVTDFSGEGVFLIVEGVQTLSGLVSKYDPRHLQRIQRELSAIGSHAYELQVNCCTFDELMKQSAIAVIDYLSIDTEGGELDLLNTIPFARFSIKVVSVENAFGDPRFEQLMNHNGYDLAAVIGDDDIYVRNGLKLGSARKWTNRQKTCSLHRKP